MQISFLGLSDLLQGCSYKECRSLNYSAIVSFRNKAEFCIDLCCVADGPLRQAPPGFGPAAASLPPPPNAFVHSQPSPPESSSRTRPGIAPIAQTTASPSREQLPPQQLPPSEESPLGQHSRPSLPGQRMPAAKITTVAPPTAGAGWPQLRQPAIMDPVKVASPQIVEDSLSDFMSVLGVNVPALEEAQPPSGLSHSTQSLSTFKRLVCLTPIAFSNKKICFSSQHLGMRKWIDIYLEED